MLVRVALAVAASGAAANMAPAEAPPLPDGWCEHGTATRTTGECMCSETACVGDGCVSEGGLHWYTLACAACACEPKPPPPRRPVEAPRPPEPVLRKRTLPAVDDDASVFDHAFDFVDEHGHKVLACLFVAALLCMFLPAFVITSATIGADGDDDADSGKRRARRGRALRLRRHRAVVV